MTKNETRGNLEMMLFIGGSLSNKVMTRRCECCYEILYPETLTMTLGYDVLNPLITKGGWEGVIPHPSIDSFVR